jgi:hypothetical protein
VEQDVLLTPPVVASRLFIREGTLTAWRARRYGPPFLRVGRRVLYRESAVIAWLHSQEQNSDPGAA